MLCKVCKDGIEGVWDPNRSKRVALVKDFDDDMGPDSEDGDGTPTNGTSKGPDLPMGLSPDQYVYGLHKDMASLNASIQQGCAMCNRFAYPFASRPNPWLKELGYLSVFRVSLDREGSPPKPAMFVAIGDFLGQFGFVPSGVPKYDDNMNAQLGSSNNDRRTWAIVDTWLNRCRTSHNQCKQPETSYLPSRLIKLETPVTFRLVHGTECPVDTRYAALSYCWGTKPVDSLLRLLQSTVKSLSLEQPVDILPKTFRHALEIIQHFGLRHIWIDRLCIFQDSTEDWHREASTMQRVYKNAYIGISALGARDDDGGCFFERDPSKVAPNVVRLKLDEDGEERAFWFDLDKGSSWRLSFENEPVVQRSWVVQERLLAPRTLHFGSKQVFWECREASCSETHPQDVYSRFPDERDDGGQDRNGSDGGEEMEQDEADEGPRHPMLWKQLLDAPRRLYSPDPYEQLFTDWNLMVGYYASRELSVASDKLSALSGLANDMKSRLQQLRPGPHRYLAGLWEEKLMDTLVWNVIGPGQAARPPSYRAPSWSWACLDGRLNLVGGLPHPGAVYFTSVISTEMQCRGPGDTGEVQGGTLTLLGPCARITIDVGSSDYPSEMGNYKSVQAVETLDGKKLPGKEGTLRMDVIFDTVDDVRGEALLLWVSISPLYRHEEEYTGRGLVLTNAGRDKYRRLGCVFNNFKSEEAARGFMNGVPDLQVMVI
ncbi:HET-domain-containing protein [Colletotrichum falcatum]|nr:HET-domain-containing protein [Colletotrichum falcatum]